MCDISVIMCVYNEHPIILQQAIESILKQTYKNFEFIIVLDNPNHVSLMKIIDSYQKEDSRMILIKNEINLGPALSANKALKLAKGKYIARMDADDISLPDRLKKQKSYIEETGLDLIGSNIVIIDSEGNDIKISDYPIKGKTIYKNLKYEDCMPHPTWFGKRKVFESLCGYMNLEAALDYNFLIRARHMKVKMGNLKDACVKYRISMNGISQSKSLLQKIISYYLKDNFNNPLSLNEREINSYLRSSQANEDKLELKKHMDKMKLFREYEKSNSWCRLLFVGIEVLFISKYGYRSLMNIFCAKMNKIIEFV